MSDEDAVREDRAGWLRDEIDKQLNPDPGAEPGPPEPLPGESPLAYEHRRMREMERRRRKGEG